MTREFLVKGIADAIEIEEGYHATEEHPWFPTLPQQLINPGNMRRWRRDEPRQYGYIDFWAFVNKGEAQAENMPRRPTKSTSLKQRQKVLAEIKAKMDLRNPELVKKAYQEGRRCLEALIGQYIDGKYTNGKSPSILKMFQTYAPSTDGNNPFRYADRVGKHLGLSAEKILTVPMEDLIDE